MPKRFLTDIDMMGFALLQAKLNPVSSDPSGLGAGDAGRIWYNSTSSTYKFWTGSGVIDVRDRGSATGTQLAATISDFANAVKAIRWAEMLAPNAAVNMNGQRLSALADPTAATDGVNRQYLEAQLAGLTSGQQPKGAVRLATTANVSLTSPGTVIDGVTLSTSDPAASRIILLAGQSTPSQNGPYLWNGGSTALVRAANWDSDAEAVLGSYWVVMQGTYADTFAVLTNDTPITLGTTAPAFVFRGQTGATYTGGAGLVLSGSDFNVGQGFGIIVDADLIRIDPTVIGRKLTGIIPASTSGIVSVSGASVTINHGLGNPRPDLNIKWGSAGTVPNAPLEVEDTYPDDNNVVITFPQAPVANQYVYALTG